MATVTVTPGYSWSSGEIVTPAKMNLAAAPTATAVVADGEITASKLAATLDLTGKTITLADNSIALAKLVAVVQQALVPVGSVIALAHEAVPAGWVRCDGGEYPKVGTYASLFGVLQTYYGETNGSGGAGNSHFRVPDLRGLFVRGSGSQVVNEITHTSGTFGRTQQDAFQGHRHPVSHNAVTGPGSQGSAGSPPFILGGATITVLDPSTDGGNGTPRTASETRPVNMALLYCIKF